MYINFTKEEIERLKNTVEYEANNADDFETMRIFVHIFDKIIEEEEYQYEMDLKLKEENPDE